MSGLVLTQTTATAQRLDMSAFTPERLADLTAGQIAAIPLHAGNQRIEAGELFRIDGEPGADLTIVPAAANLDGLGSGMTRGRLTVEGDAGALAGHGLAGGSVTVTGSAGHLAGAGMTAGRLDIAGDCGDCVGGPPTGATQGMAGGVIRVGGRAGHRAGERLRRGVILIAGDAGDFPAANIIAGTVAVGGRAGALCALGMRRGTVLLAQPPASLPATLNPNGPWRPTFLPLYRAVLGEDLFGALCAGPLERFVGDVAENGRGEVFVAGSGAAS